MKYLMIIMLIALSINTFTEDDNYVVCSERTIEKLTKCVNDYIDKGYEPKSGLHVLYKGTSLPYWFQALIKK
tara:strand:- start:1320 stop:1535 length:216 start_codon:yes stop_codon:yes gene_type:complete